jgi:hypothetical protein
MSDGSHDEKELVPRLLKFSGKQADWRMWSRKFVARATMRKYDGILLGMSKAPKEAPAGSPEISEETKTRLAKVDEVKIANSSGYVELLMAMSDEISFALVDEARTDDYPGGDLAKAWKGLMDLFEPSTAATKVTLKKQFYTNKLTDIGRDPDEWVTELELLRQRLKTLGVQVDDEDLVIHILNNLPSEYDSLVEAIEEDLNKGAADEVTVKRVRERIRARFRRMKQRQSESSGQDEIALFAKSNKFKGRCLFVWQDWSQEGRLDSRFWGIHACHPLQA